MARAQTYIIAEDNKVYSYSAEFHDDNHNTHMSKCYRNIQIKEFIPFMLSKNGNVVIDLIRHSSNGSIYLPAEPTEFQKEWLIDRSGAFDKVNWQLCKIESDTHDIYDDVKFEKVKQIILSQ